jgi:hypothetical protein
MVFFWPLLLLHSRDGHRLAQPGLPARPGTLHRFEDFRENQEVVADGVEMEIPQSQSP